MEFEFKALLEKINFTVPKRFIVGYISDIQTAEVFFFILLNRLIQTFFYFLYLRQIVVDLVSLNLFLISDC